MTALASAGCRDEGPVPERLPVPEVAEPLVPPLPTSLPPPPPPPPPAHPSEPPAELRAFLAANATSTDPWRVTFVDLATHARAELSGADALALVERLARPDAWLYGAYGCRSDGMDIRISRGARRPLVMWTSCGNVELDHSQASFAEPTIDWIRERAAALGLTPP
jgi:hypothetical protein